MKTELTKYESEVYLTLVQEGNMDEMFNLGYAIGRERLAKEQLEMFNKNHENN